MNRLSTTRAALERHISPSGLHIPDEAGISVLPAGMSPRDLVALAGGTANGGRAVEQALENTCLALRVGELRELVAAATAPTLLREIHLAHDNGVVNELALERLVRERNSGAALTLDSLAEVFGVTTVYYALIDARVLDRLADALTGRIRKELGL